MQGLKRLFVILIVAMLGAAPVHGEAQNNDCRSCHSPGAAPGAKDFSRIYATPSSHHPAGIEYPARLKAGSEFNSPGSYGTDLMFFDRNGNGQPDDDEIQLFGEGDTATVECASCHKEHGNESAPANAARNHYLRFDNAGSALCLTCHRY